MRNPTGRAVALLGSGMLLLASCSDESGFLGPQTPEGCVSGGRSYAGEVAGGTWTRNASPHVLEDSVVVVGSLEIEPGTLVCGMPGSSLTADLVAIGTADAPIVFTAADPAGWSGLRGSGTLRHARIENTVIAIFGSMLVEDVDIIRSSGVAVSGDNTLRNVAIDSACAGGGNCAAVSTPQYASTVLEDVTIRNSGGMGIVVGRRSGLVIDDVTIEGSAGVGLFVLFEIAGSGSLTMAGPVRITGGHSYPVQVHGSAAAQLLSDPANELTGNALDTLVILEAVGLGGPHVIRKELPWHVRACHPYAYTDLNLLGTITVQAGASLTIDRVNANCKWNIDLRAEGTAAEPAIIHGDGVQMHSRVVSADTARIRHAILHDVVIRADAAPIVFEDVRTIDASLDLFAAGSRVDGLHSTGSFERPWITAADPDAPAAVTLGAGTSMQRAHVAQARRDGVLINGADVTISGCTSTGNVRHGIQVTDGAPVIRDCNLFANDGMGVSNAGTGSVDAVQNWWGDAGGPLGPSGDGFEGAVQFVPFLTAPAPFACGPGCTSPGADSGFVLQGAPRR